MSMFINAVHIEARESNEYLISDTITGYLTSTDPTDHTATGAVGQASQLKKFRYILTRSLRRVLQ
jgi:hypothetical protein